ncbi:MAG: helicase-associated domain-containing protein [Anaerolineae bacterium]
MLAGLVQAGKPEITVGRPAVHEVVRGLLMKGLVVSQTEPMGTSTLRTLTQFYHFGIPIEVRNALSRFSFAPPEPRPDALRAEVPDAMHVREGELRQSLRELFFAWAELRRQPARELKSGEMGKRDRRRLAQALGLDEETGLERVAYLYEMLLALNLVTRDGSTISAATGDAVTLFWSASPVRQLRDLMCAYARFAAPLPDSVDWGRLHGIYQGISLRPISEMRDKIIALVGRIAGVGWVSYSLFYALLTGGRPGSLVLDEETLEFLFESLHWYGGSYRENVEDNLRRREQGIVQTALEEIRALGVVDLGYPSTKTGVSDSEDEPLPIALRATEEVRRYHLNRLGERPPELPWQVILQPDFQMLAMGPVPLRVLANIEQFAAREKIDESVVTYRITRDSVYEAFQRGETVSSILAYLEEASEQPVPQNITRSLEEWSRQHERIVVHRSVSILQVNDAEHLDELLADPVLVDRLHPLGDRIAWLHPDDAQAVEARLLELDMLPAHSKGPEADLRESLRWREEELEPRAAVPSLYVTGTLRRVAEADNGRWRVTPQTVGNAATLGIDPLDIIEMLEKMTGQPLSEEWEKRLKAWGRIYGDGQVARIHLLRLPRPEALAELRKADDRLHRWLRPLPGTSDLAVISEGHWEEVSEALSSWGVELQRDRWW